ncbi:hypothetical protein CYLTODRAFT_340087, partial [Cylindrobasidium torrendii FP15055 ss-10]
EIAWSQLRRRLAPGLEDVLSEYERNPTIRYEPSDPLQYAVFKWLFIDLVQAELDSYSDRINNMAKRRQRDKILPQGGSPNDIEEYPEEYNSRNFKEAEALYAPPDHGTFEKVPPAFHVRIHRIYTSIGCPEISDLTVWRVYMQLL